MEVIKQEQRSCIKIAVLSPCDYDLIPKVKKSLRGKRFANKQDILTAFLSHVSDTHEANGIQHLPYRWQRTVETFWVIILKVFNKWRLVLFMWSCLFAVYTKIKQCLPMVCVLLLSYENLLY